MGESRACTPGSMVLMSRLAKQVYRRSDEEHLGMQLRHLVALSYVSRPRLLPPAGARRRLLHGRQQRRAAAERARGARLRDPPARPARPPPPPRAADEAWTERARAGRGAQPRRSRTKSCSALEPDEREILLAAAHAAHCAAPSRSSLSAASAERRLRARRSRRSRPERPSGSAATPIATRAGGSASKKAP